MVKKNILARMDRMFSHAQHRKCVASHSCLLPYWWRHHLSPTHNLWLTAAPGGDHGVHG